MDIKITYHPANAKTEWLNTLSDEAKERSSGRITDIEVTVSRWAKLNITVSVNILDNVFFVLCLFVCLSSIV